MTVLRRRSAGPEAVTPNLALGSICYAGLTVWERAPTGTDLVPLDKMTRENMAKAAVGRNPFRLDSRGAERAVSASPGGAAVACAAADRVKPTDDRHVQVTPDTPGDSGSTLAPIGGGIVAPR